MSAQGIIAPRHGPRRGPHYLIGLGVGAIPLLLWFVVALDPVGHYGLAVALITILQLQALLALFFLIKRMRPLGYGLLTLLPVTVFLLLGA